LWAIEILTYDMKWWREYEIPKIELAAKSWIWTHEVFMMIDENEKSSRNYGEKVWKLVLLFWRINENVYKFLCIEYEANKLDN
jgi:hypothetical protein